MQYAVSARTQSLYIHWPFCPYKCHFCPFVALASQDHLMERYHAALVQEIKQFARIYKQKSPIETIHFGGGTPSTYPDNLLLDMMSILRSEFEVASCAEIALEVNPGTVRPEQISMWGSVGINRLSIGVQGINDAVLRNLNRHQEATHVYSLIDWLDGVFDNVSIDLIVGLPGVTDAEWRALIEQVTQWHIKHISIYFLTVHEGTPLYARVKTNQIVLPEDEGIVDLYQWTCSALAQRGFIQYELSNFAKPGYESRHNSAYWERVPYRGFGIGACSFDGIHRLQNEKNIMRYMQAIEQEKDVFVFCETLTEEQIRLERLMLGLRRPKGVKWHTIIAGHTDVMQKKLETIVLRLEEQQLVERVGEIIRLTHRGLSVENEVLVQLSC